MTTTNQYSLEVLTADTVSVTTKTYANINKVSTCINTTTLAYCNCPKDRATLQSMLPENYYNSIISVWGDKATFEDLPEPVIEEPATEE